MRSALVAATVLLGGVLGLRGVTLGHGGVYRGPGDTVPSNGSSRTPMPGIGRDPPLEMWQFWWEFNRDRFLDPRERIAAGTAVPRSSRCTFGSAVVREGGMGVLRPSPEYMRGRVVPLLLETLHNEKKRELLDSSMIALARIGGEDAYVDAITPFLCNPNWTLVETATISLGILGRPRALPVLESLALEEPQGRALYGRHEVPFRVRAFATYALGLLAHAVADAEVRQRVASTLVELIKEDRSSAKEIRVAATICLGLFDDPEGDRTLSALMEIFENGNEDEVVRAHAPVAVAKALNLRRNPPLLVANCVKKFSNAIEERRERDRVEESCVLALGLLTEPKSPHYAEVLKVLERTLQEAPEQTQGFAAISLAFAGGGDAVKALRRYLDLGPEGRTSVRPWVGLSLGVLAFRSRTSERSDEIEDLGGVLEALRAAMAEERRAEYAAAFGLALGLAGDGHACEPLRRRIRETEDEDSRGTLCLALGLLRDPEAEGVLEKELEGAVRKPMLLQDAAIGLGLLSDPTTVGELLEILKGAKTLSVLASVATALGLIGDPRSVDPLLQIARDGRLNDCARGFAIVALGKLADREPLPWNSILSSMANYRAFTRTLVGGGVAPGILDIL